MIDDFKVIYFSNAFTLCRKTKKRIAGKAGIGRFFADKKKAEYLSADKYR